MPFLERLTPATVTSKFFLGAIIVLAAGLLLVRLIGLPLRQLRIGTERVTQGNLDYRIANPWQENNDQIFQSDGRSVGGNHRV